MLSGVSIVCFASSYAIVLALEISRLFFRSGVRGAMMLGFAGAGLFAHTVFLIHRAAAASGSPLSSKQDWYLLAAWSLAAVYLYLTYFHFHPKNAFGVFILPLVLGLIGVGALASGGEPFAREPASKVWAAIHGTALLLATVSVLVGFAAGLMYLGQAYRLKRKLPPRRGLQLPSLEWLERANARAIVISLLFLGVGIFAGVVLNVVKSDRPTARLPWNDPLVLSTLGMFGWLFLCTVAGVFYRPARQGRKVAYLTVVSFLFLAIALGIGMSVVTQHGTGGGQIRNTKYEIPDKFKIPISKAPNRLDRSVALCGFGQPSFAHLNLESGICLEFVISYFEFHGVPLTQGGAA